MQPLSEKIHRLLDAIHSAIIRNDMPSEAVIEQPETLSQGEWPDDVEGLQIFVGNLRAHPEYRVMENAIRAK